MLFPYAYVEQLRENFRFEIASESNESFIWLKAAPVSESISQNFSSLEMIVNAKTFEIFALKAIDPVGNRETVYRFDDLKMDPEFQSETSPFQIDWDEYRVIDSWSAHSSIAEATSKDLKNGELSSDESTLKSRFQEKVDLFCSYYWKVFFKITELSYPE